jgi:hypothetical protein
MFSDSLPEMRDQVSVSLEPADSDSYLNKLESDVILELETLRESTTGWARIALNLSIDTIKRKFEDERTREAAIS